MTTPMVELSSVTELPSLLDVGQVTLVKQFLTLVIECNIVYLILEFSHIKVGSNINYNPKLISFFFSAKQQHVQSSVHFASRV